MKIRYYLLTISLIIEGIISNFISIQTKLWSPLLLLMTIIFIYPYFKNDKKYYKMCLIYGILYDLIYTNTLVFHGFLFLLIGYIVHYLYKLFSLKIINIIIHRAILIYPPILIILLFSSRW